MPIPTRADDNLAAPLSVRLHPATDDEVRAWADAEGVIVSDLLRHMIEECLARRAATQEEGE